ncbi:hypothetical protein [Methanohalophilus sp.]|uniref:hypothetical protein n=1 Tax=Methanohalophilus sp. TaxID=1966352 RepID=UPI00261507EC|nr:hypothetical protein [Methanohalophilus sp.]MDK2893052.1 hypothetical protein [Methanohalophilus sp.]
MKSKIIALLLSLTLVMLAVSGCTDTDREEKTGEMDVSDVVVLKEIPAGFEYLGARMLSVGEVLDGVCNESEFVESSEGIYKGDGFDIYVTTVETPSEDDAENLVSRYKATFPPMSKGDRFIEESINDHFVTRIVWHVTNKGEEVERYAYIWNNGSYVFHIRGGTSDPLILREFAEATGY